jgi:Zn-dependent peptidase ImmA (M78 family)
MKVENINITILKELYEKMPEDWRIAINKYPKINEWLNGKDYPTYNQLVELSKIFHIPFGYFFLDKLPERKYPIPHYRTIKNGDFKPSSELLDTILFAQKVQEWARDILIEWGNEKISFCGKFKNNFDANSIIEELKIIFDVKSDWASLKNRWIDVFKYLVQKAEEKGIIVLINRLVGNNPQRKLNIEEFRGFVLYDEIAPVVFINNNDAISAKTFTLIHEVVHILTAQSASFDLRNLQSAENEIEKFCDRCTAEFLVPEQELTKEYKKTTDINALAKHFKVSNIVIIRRLLDTNLITREKFYKELKGMLNEEFKKPGIGGGNFYNIEKNRLSIRFLTILKRAVDNNTILFRDALRVTNLKIKTFDNLMGKII